MPGKISAGDKGLEWREKVLWTQDTFHVDMERGCLLKLTLASTSQVHQGRNLRSLLEKGDIPEDRASSQPGPSKHTGYAQAPQALARPLQRAPISGLPGGLAIAPEPLRTMEQQDTVDVACGPYDSECNMGKETGATLVVGPGLRGCARPRGRGRSCTTRIQARCLVQTTLPCSSMEYHPPETQVPAEKFGLQNGPVTSDQASVSDTIECEEILQAAAALMTLKNSSWILR
ncbi:hypothetical protein ACRRTK_002369 [Alexandromys fortis]